MLDESVVPAELLNRFWTSVVERARGLARLPSNVDPVARAITLADELLSERGEATGAVRAEALLAQYGELDANQRHDFHLYLAGNFLPEPNRLRAAAQAYLVSPDAETVAELTAAAVPPRQELFRRMNIAPGATLMLVAMREALLEAVPKALELKPLEQDLHHLLRSWFNRGFLELRRIDWNTSATILEKLIAYEAVHEIRGWDDLRRRLAPDRRCFAFMHPALPDEPLIFVEVALCQGMAAQIAPLLSIETPPNGHDADTAVFYSIHNCQPGLRGISFGNFLIKNVVEELKAELPRLKCFATLSPVPGFRGWLERKLAQREETVLHESEGDIVGSLDAFAASLAGHDWQSESASSLKIILQRLCASYLTELNDGLGSIDPVARFHLRNGARLERINWRANTTPRGIAESYGLMVNYLYDPDTIEVNHEKFVGGGRVAHSSSVAEMLRNGSKTAHKRLLAKAAE